MSNDFIARPDDLFNNMPYRADFVHARKGRLVSARQALDDAIETHAMIGDLLVDLDLA